MPRGIPWTTEQETELKTLLNNQTPLDVIALKLGKKPGAVTVKIKRLKLNPTNPEGNHFTDQITLPKGLPSIEAALKMLAGALQTAIKPGLTKIEVQRLQTVANIAKTYKEFAADYARYDQIEAKLLEMETKYEKLLQQTKTPNENPPTKN
jgi:hypothetical protein